MSVDTDSHLVSNSSELRKAAKIIRSSAWIAFDLEADSLHSYPEQVCLIQIGCESGQYLIDCIEIDDITPLFNALKSKELIIHGCDYDLKLMSKLYDFSPSRIFDTKEAARLIGMRKFGLSALTEEFLGIELEKSGQKANWSLRPLKPSLLEYATKDVLYLHDVYQILSTRLEELGRSQWHQQTCQRLIRIFSRVDSPDPDLVWRMKGSQKLNRLGLAVLKEIWEWREDEALILNRPPFFVLPHKKVIEIAEAVAAKKAYQGIIPRRFPTKRRTGLIAAIQQGIKTRATDRPTPLSRNRGNRFPNNGKKIFSYDELKEHRDKMAEDLDLEPTIIASRSELESLAAAWDEAADQVMPWQWGLFSSLQS